MLDVNTQVHAVSVVPGLLGSRRSWTKSPSILSHGQCVCDGVPHGQGEADPAEAEGCQSTGSQRLARTRYCRCKYFNLLPPAARLACTCRVL